MITEKLVAVVLNNNKLTGELYAEITRSKKLQINVQGNKPINLSEELCKMKKCNGRLVGTFGCDAILIPQIPSLLRAEGGILMRSVSHVLMGTYPII